MEQTVSFSDLGLSAEIVSALSRQGITVPFEVQTESIPDAMLGKDICCRAPTGSGKTLAFGLPLIAKCPVAEPHYPTALILTPTRELAEQITTVLTPLAEAVSLEVISVYGGVSYNKQMDALRRGTDILVACPGRLLDLIDKGALDLDDIEMVVLDEADRMADMGFIDPVCDILNMCTSIKQTILFSATLDDEVGKLIKDYQEDPVTIEVGPKEVSMESMKHLFWLTQGMKRATVAAEAIATGGKSIVFCRTRRAVDKLGDDLANLGLDVATLHGGLSQRQRDRAMSRFSSGWCEALIATDVAARGIDVQGVHCVIHLDPAENGKAYKHRSGRTARAGASGIVISMVQDNQRGTYNRIQKQVGIKEKYTKPDLNLLPVHGKGALEDREPRKRKPDSRSSRDGQRSGGGNSRYGGNNSGGRRSSGGNSSYGGNSSRGHKGRNNHNDNPSKKGRRSNRHSDSPRQNNRVDQ
jgi:superfamily II DNA/RNA helicase